MSNIELGDFALRTSMLPHLSNSDSNEVIGDFALRTILSLEESDNVYISKDTCRLPPELLASDRVESELVDYGSAVGTSGMLESSTMDMRNTLEEFHELAKYECMILFSRAFFFAACSPSLFLFNCARMAASLLASTLASFFAFRLILSTTRAAFLGNPPSSPTSAMTTEKLKNKKNPNNKGKTQRIRDPSCERKHNLQSLLSTEATCLSAKAREIGQNSCGSAKIGGSLHYLAPLPFFAVYNNPS